MQGSLFLLAEVCSIQAPLRATSTCRGSCGGYGRCCVHGQLHRYRHPRLQLDFQSCSSSSSLRWQDVEAFVHASGLRGCDGNLCCLPLMRRTILCCFVPGVRAQLIPGLVAIHSCSFRMWCAPTYRRLPLKGRIQSEASSSRKGRPCRIVAPCTLLPLPLLLPLPPRAVKSDARFVIPARRGV